MKYSAARRMSIILIFQKILVDGFAMPFTVLLTFTLFGLLPFACGHPMNAATPQRRNAATRTLERFHFRCGDSRSA